MDELYENLENYDDVNAVNELKTENRELKLKLEEYAKSMDRLQKEFDKLSSEFKKLEVNYSSLLRTAKSEIERKAQMIINLNKEKDALVCSAFEKRNNSFSYKNKKMGAKTNNSANSNMERTGNLREKSDIPYHRDTKFDTKRKNFNTSEDAKSSSSTETSNKFTAASSTRVSASSEALQNNKGRGEYKENVEDRLHRPDTAALALSLQNRRKSMHIFNDNVKLSSDEEFEQLYSAEEYNVRNIPKYRDFNKDSYHVASSTKRFDRVHDEGNRQNEYEYRKSKASRFYNQDKSRGRGRFERPHYNRQYSPDKILRRDREFRDTYQRTDYVRNKVLQSPPRDRYHKEVRDWQQNWPPEYRRQDTQFTVITHHANKHKLACDSDEPLEKRIKIDSIKKNDFKTSKNKKEIITEEPIMINSMRHLQQSTCQSPDFSPVPDHSISVKEIPNDIVIETNQQDPRRKKNNLNNSENLFKLSTGSDDLQVIDRTKWNSKEVPNALTSKPLTDEIYKEIYDFDLPLESGEESESEISDIRVQDKQNKNTNESIENIVNDVKAQQSSQQNPPSTNNKIPKLNKNADKGFVTIPSTQNIEKFIPDATDTIQKSTVKTHKISYNAKRWSEDIVPIHPSTESVKSSTVKTVLKPISETESPPAAEAKKTELEVLTVVKNLGTDKQLTPDAKLNKNADIGLVTIPGKHNMEKIIPDGTAIIQKCSLKTSKISLSYNAKRRSQDNVDHPSTEISESSTEKTVLKPTSETESPPAAEAKKPEFEVLKVVKKSILATNKQLSTDVKKNPEINKIVTDIDKCSSKTDKQLNLDVMKPHDVNKPDSHTITTSVIDSAKKCSPEMNKNGKKSVKDDCSNSCTTNDEKHKRKKKSSDKDKEKKEKKKPKKESQKTEKIEDSKKIVEGDLEMSDSDTECCPDKNKTKLKSKSKKLDVKSSSSSGAVGLESKHNYKDKCTKNDIEKLTTKTKHSKTKETVKTKFTYLFGDSNSLITPEDLELPALSLKTNSDEFFENAVDLNVDDMIKVQSRVADTKTAEHVCSKPKDLENLNEPSGEIDSQNNRKLDPQPEGSKKKKETTTTSTESSFKNEVVPIKEISPDTETSIVKTVIISTGVQNNRVLDIATACHLDNVSVLPISEFKVKALATSTPEHNMVSIVEKMQTQETITENNVVTIPAVSVTVDEPEPNDTDLHLELSASKSIADISDTPTAVANPETNLPDVRIFIKRRRKVIKKTNAI